MEFRVLGPTEMWSAGQPCDLGPRRTRSVLAILLLAPRTIVPAETLIDRLWGTEPPPKARESLFTYVAKLRASLRLAAGDGVRLAGRANGYLLDVDPDLVDVHRFRRMRRQAAALAASGDRDHAALLLREAEDLWRGQPLAGMPGDWAARMRDSLDEERRAVVVERIGCELELGRHADLVGELSGLLAQYPLDETLVAHQMTALYGSGRPADALSLYRQTRDRLVEEQGTEPGPALSELHQRVLRHDPQLDVSLAARRRARGPQQGMLPPETAEFVGRREELALLAAEPAGDPQISLIEGMPGVGKTTLAVRAARMVSGQYPDGIYYLNLHSNDPQYPSLDPAEALRQLLTMLNVPAAQIPAALSERAALWNAQLSRRRAVVILDDAAGHDQVRPLLPATGCSLVLITARSNLAGLEAARVVTLDVMAPDEAAALFTRIAGPVGGRDAEEIAAAVRLCGRLPLAIQLAAGRLAQASSLRLADLVGELSASPAHAGSSGFAGLEVMPAFELSYRALQPDHQRLFRLLGVSPCPEVSLHTAAALCGWTAAEAEQAITTLADHHLLIGGPAGRFRFHDLIREYAAARAAQDDTAPARRQAVGRLLDYYLHAADQADRVLHPFRNRTAVTAAMPPPVRPALGTPDDAAAWLELEWRNVLQAARYAGRHEWHRQCADLAHLVAGFVEIRGHWEDAIAAHTMALQACRDLADAPRTARAALELSVVSQQAGRPAEALALAEEAAAIYESLADRCGLAAAVDQIGLAHQRAARSHEALAYFREARALFGDAADHHGVADTLSHSGIACWQLGRYPEALGHLDEALSLYRQAGDRRGEAKALTNLGKMQLLCGYHRDALDSFLRSLEIFRVIGGAQNQAILYHNIGIVHHYKGSYEESLAACRQALELYRDLGDLPDEADVLNDIGAIFVSAERYDEALIHYQDAGQVAQDIGNVSEQVTAFRGLATVHRGRGRYAEATEHYDAALRLARQIGDPYEEAKTLEGIAETTLRTRGPRAARIVFSQALDIFDRLGVPEAEAVRIRLETTSPALARRTSLPARTG
jgi:DNA-binding SARP family transcriptional activator/tetratricopeptide (TPR) repeat protein